MSNRTIKDAKLAKTKALPAADANVDTDSIDLGQVTAFPINEEIDFSVEIPATTALAEGVALTVKLQDSADDSSFADIDGLGAQTVTGAVGDGNDATVLYWKLPGSTRRYVHANIALAASGGDVTGSSAVAQLLV